MSVIATAILVFVLGLLVKVSLLLALALALPALLFSRRAGARHYLRAAALLALVSLPGLSLVMPPLRLSEPTALSGVVEASLERFEAFGRSRAAAERSGGRDETRAWPADDVAALPFTNRVHLMLGALAVWIAGAMILLSSLALAHVRVQRLVTVAWRLEAQGWRALLQSARQAVGVASTVELRMSDLVRVPMTVGFFAPIILLPIQAERWTDERKRLVLLHELAHIERGDWLVRLFAEVALALAWVHPLAWLLVRALKHDSELAADDVVLATGERASTYASHLLAIKADAPSPAAVGISLPWRFHGRMEALLSRHALRAPLATRFRVAAASVVVALAAFLSAAQRSDEARGTLSASATPEDAPRGHTNQLVRSLFRSALLAVERGAHADALALLESAVAAGFDDPARLRAEPRLEPLRADPEFQELVRLSDDLSLMQVLASARPHWERAFARFSAVVAERPAMGRAWFNLGVAQLKSGRARQAIDSFERAAQLAYGGAVTLYNLACSYAQAGYADHSVAVLAAAIDAGFDSARILRTDRDLEPLRGDHRYARLLARVEAQPNPSGDWKEAF